MIDSILLQELQAAYRADEFYLTLVSPKTCEVLQEIINHPYFPGSSDPPLLALIGTLLRIMQPQRLLQLGTHVGFSTIYFADILKHNARPGQLITVDPDAVAGEYAQQWVTKANLTTDVIFLRGYSTDLAIAQQLHDFGQFDLIYLDSSHAYSTTLQELTLIFGEGGWLRSSGCLLLHDAGEHAMQFDPTGSGGVRRAMQEWLAKYSERYHHLILEPPLWPNACGIGLIAQRGQIAPTNQAITHSFINESAQLWAEKEAHIAQLQEKIRLLESGRVMRLLNWLQRFIRPAMSAS